MIDWPSVVHNALWIIGCAVMLAAFSYANWLAHLRGVRTRQLLSTPNIQLPFVIGLGLVSLGLFFLSRGWLEYVLWAVFFFFSAWQSWRLWRGSPN